MTSPDRARAVAELDALTEQLPERAAQVARHLDRIFGTRIVNGRAWRDGKPVCPSCLAQTCDCPVTVQPDPVVAVVNGGVVEVVDGEALCVWCREPAGTCDRTGGQDRCDGTNEWHADQLAVAAAPRIHTPIQTGGAW